MMDFLLMVVMFGSGAVAGWLARSSEVRRLREEHACELRAMDDMLRQKSRSISAMGGWLKRRRLT